MKKSWALKNDDYRELRNSLIPAAEAHADKVCGKKPKKLDGDEVAKWGYKWNKVFLKEMQVKAKLIGIVE